MRIVTTLSRFLIAALWTLSAAAGTRYPAGGMRGVYL